MTAFSKFKKAFDKDLSNKQKRMLDQKIEIEKFRSDGRWVNILFAKGPFVHKIRNILFSNKHFYKIKMLLDTYLIGW